MASSSRILTGASTSSSASRLPNMLILAQSGTAFPKIPLLLVISDVANETSDKGVHRSKGGGERRYLSGRAISISCFTSGSWDDVMYSENGM
jgi:hypothetical protein